MTGFTQDLRCTARQLGKAPGFAAIAIVTLALGIGANTAIFSLLDQALLRSLPVKDADRLVVLQFTGNGSGHVSSRTDNTFSFSYPMYRDLRDRNSVLSGLIATDQASVGVQWHNQPELIDAEMVSAGVSIAVALPASLMLARVARSQLFGISSSDPLTLTAATLLVSVVALASAMLPARRAAKTDPIVVLRYE